MAVWKARAVAVVFSLFAPGAGHAYLGCVRPAVLFSGLFIALTALAAALQAFDPAVPGFGFAFLGAVAVSAVLSVLAVINSVFVHNTDLDTPRGQRLKMAALAALVVWTVNGAGYWATESYGSWRPYVLASGSMEPAFQVGDYVLGRFEGPPDTLPARGAVVLFKKTVDDEETWLKRVIGLPGDELQTVGGRVVLNGERLDYAPVDGADDLFVEPLGADHVVRLARGRSPLDNASVTVPDGHVFVMGDNRPHSIDSRSTTLFGFVPLSSLVGRPGMIYWSADWRRIGRVPG